MSKKADDSGSDRQEELQRVAEEMNKPPAQETREQLEAMFSIPGCMKKGGVDYPDNLIGIATCSVAGHRDSGGIVGKYGEWRLYRIGEHNQAYRLELETEGATHFHEFNPHHVQVNGERNRITFTQPSSS